MKLTPQQQQFKEYYLNPSSETFGNAKRSALKAGYSENYSNNLTGQGSEWIDGLIRDYKMLAAAEAALAEALDHVGEDAQHKKIKVDVAKFVAKGMAKDKYSDKVIQDNNLSGEVSFTIERGTENL